MQQRPRKPGDQAPPYRPAHRNPGKTATTHVKDTAGRLYRVHDGSPAKVTIVIEGEALDGLTYDNARKAKEIAVARKYRKASIEEVSVAPPEAARPFAGEGNPVDQPNPDPQLEAARQRALAAARPAAQAAQARHEAQKENHPKTPIVGLDPIDETDDADVDGMSDEDLENMLAGGSRPTGDDAQRAKEQADTDAQLAEIAGKQLFERELVRLNRPDLPQKWEELSEERRQSYRWRAINETDVRVGDIVEFFGPHGADGNPTSDFALVVQVHTAQTINLQLGVNLDTNTADGEIIRSVSRVQEGVGPVPSTWRPVQ